MFYIKLWKTESDSFFRHNQVDISEVVYSFLNEIEALVYDLTKSVLIDADSLQFKPSIIVASLISISLDIYLSVTFSSK